MIRQVYVPDVFRKFADALDARGDNPVRQDMDRTKLTAMLDAFGKFAAQCGLELRTLKIIGLTVFGTTMRRNLTDELRRFADMLERRKDAVKAADPGYKKLADCLRAMSMYAGWMGVDPGIGRGHGSLVDGPLPAGRN